MNDYAAATTGETANDEDQFWQTDPENTHKVPYGVDWNGIVVRSTWDIDASPPRHSGSTSPVKFADIHDGASNTFFVGEKRVAIKHYHTGFWNDDRGWADGWDSDTIRGSHYRYGPDSTTDPNPDGYSFGAAHSVGMNSVWADGSVRVIDYKVDAQLFNDLADRRDGNVVASQDF